MFGIDLDDTLIDLESVLHAHLREQGITVTGVRTNYEHIHDIIPNVEERLRAAELATRFWDNPRWLEVAQPHAGAREALMFLRDKNLIGAYITARPAKHALAVNAWLESNGFPNAPVMYTHEKARAMRENRIGILIDDKPSTLEAVKNAGLGAIVFNQPWNHHVTGLMRMDGWESTHLHMLKFIATLDGRKRKNK